MASTDVSGNISTLSEPCSMAFEDAFGPIVVSPCAQGFDFTLLFEEAILTMLPLGIAMVWSLLRAFALWKETPKTRPSWLLVLKTSVFTVYLVLQVVLLVLWATSHTPKTRLSVACSALTVAVYAVLWLVSYLEHARSVRPSTLLCVYLAVSILLDMPRARTLFFIPDARLVADIFLVSLIFKIIMFIFELVEKRKLLWAGWHELSPEATSGVFNRALFIWLNSVFIKGFRSRLTIEGLVALDRDILSASEPSALINRWHKVDKSSKDALLWTFLIHYKWQLFEGVLPRLAYAGFIFSQPFLVERTLDFVAEPSGTSKSNTAYGLVGAFAIVYIGISISYAVYHHKSYRVLTMFRGSLITLIFGKTLSIRTSGAQDGEAITLMSADIDRIGTSVPLLHETYASLIEVGLAMWLLYRLLGVAMVAPIVWIFVCLVAGLPLAAAAGNAQTPWLEAIEDRLAVTSTVLSALKFMRMTGLTGIVSSKIADLRSSEIQASRHYRLMDVLVTVTFFASSTLAPVWAFGGYILLAKSNGTGTLTDSLAFSSLSLFELLSQPLIFIVDGFEHIQTLVNSFRRIQEYLMSDDREDYRSIPSIDKPLFIDVPILHSWETSEISLIDIPQTNNKITFGADPHQSSDFDTTKFVAVVRDATAGYAPEGPAVLRDLYFEIPRGQTTMVFGPVGSGKSTLLRLLLGEVPSTSGSVMANFSTAAYCPQSPWITWDTVQANIVGMSPWDQTWYNTVVHSCALSQDFEELPNGDQTNTGTRGSRLSGGQQMRVSFARALYSRNHVFILDDVLTGLDRVTERSILDAVFGPDALLKKQGATVVLATNSVNQLQYADNVLILDSGGRIIQRGTLESLSASGLIQEHAAPPAALTPQPELQLNDEALQELSQFEDVEPDTLKRPGDLRIYAYYANIAGWWSMLAYLFACAAFVFGVIFPPVWLQWWTNANNNNPNERIGYWLGIYGGLTVVTLLGCALADFIFKLVIVPKTSAIFHELLLATTMRAQASSLTKTDAGTTLNRFSQDLELIDNDLPKALDLTIFYFLSTIVSAVLVFVGSGYASIAIPLCLVILAFIQFYYLRTSKQLRLLDIEAKAPLFSHFLETLGGGACIRAYGWTGRYVQRNHAVLNTSQKPYYLMWCIQRWLTLVLDLFVAGIAVLLVAIATNIQGGSTAYLGVALFNVVTFSTTLQELVSEWTQVETATGAISRIRSYVSDTQDENLAGEVADVPENWPTRGAICFQDVSASYNESAEPILQEITFSIQAGEKVAVCGRSGSGKSSLVSTLLRMLNLTSGVILIDGIDITTIPRQEVRQRINTLPQETFFLHGTVRHNVDPLARANDERIIQVLHDLQLGDFLDAQGGLDADLEENILSSGQKQLFCLARAILKTGSILILDEATSSVDAETERLMQHAIRNEFNDHTIIAVAHKLDAVLDFDRIMVLDKGRIIESGRPQELLATTTSAFRALYESVGYDM